MIYAGSARRLLVVLVVLPTAIAVLASCGEILGVNTNDPPTNGNGEAGSNDGPTTAKLRENCLDGKDNDEDGLIDCADPDCTQAGYSCRDAPPEGWDLVELHRSAWQPTPPSTERLCPGAFERRLAGPEGVGGGESCVTCACQAAICTEVVVDCNDTLNCELGGNPTSIPLTSNACAEQAPTSTPSTSCRVIANPPANGPGCDAVTTSPVVIPPPWKEDITLCIAEVGAASRGGGGCTTPGHACLPTSPKAGKACLHNKGPAAPPTTECPGGWPAKETFYSDQFADGRTCSPCTCGYPALAVSCVDTVVKAFSSPNCTLGATTPDTGRCFQNMAFAQSAPWSLQLFGSPRTNAVCPPDGGKVDGTVSRGEAEMFCCAP